jgi:DNA-binding MarR family transcriptional regulator
MTQTARTWERFVDRERLVDEIMMLLPALARGLGCSGREELGEISGRGILVDVHLSPGHVQVLISLSRGPCSIRRLAKALRVSSPAVTQLVNHLEEHKIVERHHDPSDRRVVLVAYAPRMQDIARKIMERRGRRLTRAAERLTEEEARALLKGLNLLVESFERSQGEPA